MDKIHITLVDLGLLVIPLVGLLSLQKEAPKNRDTVAARKWIQLEKISLVVFFLLSVVALFLRLLFRRCGIPFTASGALLHCCSCWPS